MKLKILAGAFILIAMFATTGAAQQDPLDLGFADSAFFVISEPIVGAVDQLVTAELYFWNDAQDLSSVAFGFGWDNPNFQMETTVWSPDAMSAFNMMQLDLYRLNLDSTNINQKFQCVAMRMMGTGLVRSTTAKLVVTYTFRVSSWSESDQFCINTEDFNTNTFVDTDGSNEYVPMFDGPFCIGNIPTGVLEVDPATLDFTGVAGGANPPAQTVLVTEAGGDNIDYFASEGSSFITLTNAVGTTPDNVGVAVDITGLVPGIHGTTISITSPSATNKILMHVRVHLDAPNQAPVMDPIGNQSGPEETLIEFTVTASDPDGTTPTMSSSLPPSTSEFIDNGDGTGTFSWETTYADAGDYPITFVAYDGELSDEETITITVTNVNRDPVLDPIADQQVLEGANLNFVVTASDPDMDALTMTAATLPGTATFTDNDDGTGTFDWTPGNTDAGIYNVTFTAADAESYDEQTISIEVIDADGFLLDPNPLVFAADFGSVGPWEQPFSVTVSDGSMTEFTASTEATWFTLSSAGGTTPSSITVFVDITGLAAGFYHDSILIAGTGLDPVYEDVELTISNNLVVDPTEFTLTASEGDLVIPVEQYIAVTEMGGDAIAFEATTEATWLMFGAGSSSGITPASILVGCLPADRPGPGVYNSTIVITADAVNSPITIPVTLIVTECPTLAPAEVVYEHMAFAGETVMFDETIALTSSGPGEIEWEAMGTMAIYTFDPTTGTTPSDLGVHYEQTFDAEGIYSDTAYVNSVTTGIYSCPSEVMIITNVTINRPPSADTIIVESPPAVPGMRVGVPVIFTNSCRLTGLGFSLNWANGLYLDSVSFTGSAVEYVDNKVVEINNDLGDVKITADIGDQMMVPIGSKQLLATLFFALPCEIEDGAYEFGLGATPPLEPADVYFYRDCGAGIEVEFPEPVPGSIVVGSASNFVCGYVVDPDFNEIEGATVELWEDYPFTTPLLTTTSSGIGSFAFDELMVIPFDLYAYKEGYYPGSVEDNNFGDKGIMIVLEPLPETPIWPSQYVDYYCPAASNTFLGAPIPVGAVVEAYTQNNLLVGQKMVTISGQYGLMPVYADYDQVGDDGAIAGDMIRFTINGMDAIATGNTTYPDFTIYDRMEVCLEVRGTVEKVCTLFEDWNLISWNVNTETDDILTVLAPVMEYVDVVLGFEQGGLTFDPDLQMFSTLWDVDHYSGYWVRIEGASEVALTITGLPVAETTPIALTTGWNLVSYLPEESWPTETALGSVVDVVQFAYGFPLGNIQVWTPSGTFNQLETFDPCNGYWIKTTANTWLTYDNSMPPVTSPRPQQQELALSSRIAQTNWVNLYSKNLTVDDQVVTTGATITAHAVKNDDVVGTFTLGTDGQFGFMPVYASAPGETVTGLQAGEEFYLAVNDITTDEVFTWTNNGDRIEVSELSTANSIGEVIPDDYSLAQNYPNPFNPTTSIAFYMPVTGHVKVEIYNVLGRSIAVIFDGQAQAGENKVVWDGRDTNGDATASGVYFYRLTADKYTETRKMMLLK